MKQPGDPHVFVASTVGNGLSQEEKNVKKFSAKT
jgi:hypothetical protein